MWCSGIMFCSKVDSLLHGVPPNCGNDLNMGFSFQFSSGPMLPALIKMSMSLPKLHVVTEATYLFPHSAFVFLRTLELKCVICHNNLTLFAPNKLRGDNPI